MKDLQMHLANPESVKLLLTDVCTAVEDTVCKIHLPSSRTAAETEPAVSN
jgi:hypothetical protein